MMAADKAITRNRYGKNMRGLLLILMQRPGQWYTLGRDNITVQAAKALHRKRAIEMSEDGKRARVKIGQTDAIPHVTEVPDGWIVYEKYSDRPRVETDGDLVKSLLRLEYIVTARPFRYLE